MLQKITSLITFLVFHNIIEGIQRTIFVSKSIIYTMKLEFFSLVAMNNNKYIYKLKLIDIYLTIYNRKKLILHSNNIIYY